MKRPIRNYVMIILATLTFCIVTAGLATPDLTRQAYPWSTAYILTFHGHRYDVSKSHVVGVSHYLETESYHGIQSGVYPLYSIPGIPQYLVIAVKTSTGYLLAVQAR